LITLRIACLKQHRPRMPSTFHWRCAQRTSPAPRQSRQAAAQARTASGWRSAAAKAQRRTRFIIADCAMTSRPIASYLQLGMDTANDTYAKSKFHVMFSS
jgi:hypothetical protein